MYEFEKVKMKGQEDDLRDFSVALCHRGSSHSSITGNRTSGYEQTLFFLSDVGLFRQDKKSSFYYHPGICSNIF